MWIKAEMVYGKRGDNDTRPVHQLINMNNVCSISTGSYKPEAAGSEWAECTEFLFTDGSGLRTTMTWEELESTIANGEGFPDQAESADKPNSFVRNAAQHPVGLTQGIHEGY